MARIDKTIKGRSLRAKAPVDYTADLYVGKGKAREGNRPASQSKVPQGSAAESEGQGSADRKEESPGSSGLPLQVRGQLPPGSRQKRAAAPHDTAKQADAGELSARAGATKKSGKARQSGRASPANAGPSKRASPAAQAGMLLEQPSYGALRYPIYKCTYTLFL